MLNTWFQAVGAVLERYRIHTRWSLDEERTLLGLGGDGMGAEMGFEVLYPGPTFYSLLCFLCVDEM